MEQKYKNFIRRKNFSVLCQYCETRVHLREFNQHVKDHGANLASRCIWCMMHTWRKKDGSAAHQYEHRYACMLDRINRDKVQDICELNDGEEDKIVNTPPSSNIRTNR